MKRSVQQKIDQLVALSKKPVAPDKVLPKQTALRADSLSSAIRSKKDADIFMSELQAILNSAKK